MVSFGQNPGFTWGGTGSTTATTDYNLGTNWANPPVGAPPVSAGQAAVFGAAGSSTVVVTAGPVTPDSWTFNATSQSFLISGAAVNFSRAGPGGGIIDNANFGQTISISNNIGETVAGVQVQQLGNSTLILSGTNTYTGGTTINAGTLQLGTLATTGSIVGTVINAGAFSIVNADTRGITSITNNGGSTLFLNATSASAAMVDNTGQTIFGVQGGTDTATAGNATILNRFGGISVFYAKTTADSSTIANQSGGQTGFSDSSNAGKAIIVNRYGGSTFFGNNSNAGNANITNGFGGNTYFGGNSSAGNATITNNSLFSAFYFLPGLGFFQASTAGTATIVNNDKGFIIFGFNFSSDVASADHATITNNSGSELEFNGLTTAGSATIITPKAVVQYTSPTGQPAATRSS
jgi:autotransporter-associated beta strand protein